MMHPAQSVAHGAMLALLAVILATSEASAHHKPGHHIPAGLLKKHQLAPADLSRVAAAEHVCLVTTSDPDDPYAEIVDTEWLPRRVAEELIESEGGFIIIHPDLQSADGCDEFSLGY
jgi:hypothetical protein